MVYIQLNQPHPKEWLRSKSGINEKYFKDKAYKALREKVGSSLRYARADVKEVVCAVSSCRLPLTDHFW